jgi:hypothetical protein
VIFVLNDFHLGAMRALEKLQKLQRNSKSTAPAMAGKPFQKPRQGGNIEERFLHCVSRLLRRSEGEEKASAYFGRNDRGVAGALVGITML